MGWSGGGGGGDGVSVLVLFRYLFVDWRKWMEKPDWFASGKGFAPH
jgi:hypothetical protein